MRFFSKLSTWSNLANVLLNKIWYSFVPSVPRYMTLTPPWVHCKSQASMGPWEQRGPMASRGKSPRTARVWLRWKRFRPAIHCLEVWFMDVYGTLGGWEDFSGVEGFWDGKGGMEIAEGIYILTPNITPGPGGFEVLCPKYHSERFNLKIYWKRKILYVFDLATLHFFGVHVSNVAWLLMITLLKWKFTRLYPGWTLWLNHIPDDPCMEHLPIHLA